jgi:hypothetical protein
MAEILSGFEMRHILFPLQDARFMKLPETHQSVNRTPVNPFNKWARSEVWDDRKGKGTSPCLLPFFPVKGLALGIEK